MQKFRKSAVSNDSLALLIYAVMTAFLVILAVFLLIGSIATTVNFIKNTDFNSFPFNIFSTIGNAISGKEDHPFRQEIDFKAPEYPEDLSANTNGEIVSTNFVAIDVNDNKVIQSKRSTGEPNRIYPASLTKVMSLIVIFENLKNEDSLKETLTVSAQTHNNMVAEGSSGYGFVAGESFTVETAIYALMLQSDGWAAITLAEYIAGSEAGFAEMMNTKAEEMGLQDTHFTNCTGLHDPNHYSTAYDMAQILMYAMKNTYCSNVLRATHFNTSTSIKGDIIIYNKLLTHNLKDGAINPSNGRIIGGKTGYTPEAGYCLASYIQLDSNGRSYVIVTTGSKATGGTGTVVNDHILICETYFK